MNSSKKRRRLNFLEFLALGLCIISAVLIIGFSVGFSRGYAIKLSASIEHPEIFSYLGDFLSGIIGPILSIAGVLLLYSALIHQRKEIKINQEALTAQIEEFKGQKQELTKSNNI